MLDPNAAFSIASTLALVAWIALVAALFVAALRRPVWLATGIAIPVLLAVAYIVLLVEGFGTSEGGGFASIAEVRALFASDAGLAAGWLHYLAFDLFVGTWISRDGLARRIPALLLVPCLALTFLAGPAGLLLFFVLRLAFRRSQAEAVA